MTRNHERRFCAVAYPRPWRFVAAVLLAVGLVNLPAMLFAVLLVRSIPITRAMLVRTLVVFTLFPVAGAWVLARLFAVTVDVDEGRVRLAGLGRRIDIPADAVGNVVPWRVPLPGPGLSIRRHALQMRDPLPLLARLATIGVAPAAAATAHSAVVYAHTRAARDPARWWALLAKFPLFALFPTAVLFNAHQHIAYGGLLGQYYLLGLGAYLETFAVYWTTVTIYVVLYASLWRGLGEAVALLAAWIAPARAARVRRDVERACRALYYVGVPVLLALRFAPW